MLLVKDLGYALPDIRGERRVERMVTEPTGAITAITSIQPRLLRVGIVGSLLLALGALQVGVLGGAIISVVFGYILYLASRVETEGTETVTVHEIPGMTDREVWETLVLNDEDESVKETRMQEESRRAERQAQGSA